MKTEPMTLKGVPALLLGEPSHKVYLYVHSEQGSKEEAIPFAELACAAGYQVLAMDLPGHGARRNDLEKLLPDAAVPELQFAYQYAKVHWRQVSLRATGVGVGLSMLALQERALKQALFVSPVLEEDHPLHWNTPTQVLYGAEDERISRASLDRFKRDTGAHLTIMEEAGHWFHTENQLAALQSWEEYHL